MDNIGLDITYRSIFDDSNLAAVQEFLAQGGNPNKQYYGGLSVFQDAINTLSDNIKVVEELIKAGADVNFRSHLDYTPLHFAVSYRKVRVVRALIESGSFVNAKTFLGETNLHLAVTPLAAFVSDMKILLYPDSTVINYLLQHEDTDCNAMNSDGDTPLMVAVKFRQVKAVAQLLRKKADPNICNNAFETPLHAAFCNIPNYNEIQLLKSGANIYALDKSGQTPLDILFKYGLPNRPIELVFSILKLVAFHYNITKDLKRKLEVIPQLSQPFNTYCDEVYRMRSDFLSENISMHDFCSDCFNVKDFKYEVELMRIDPISGHFTMPGVCWDNFEDHDFKYHQIHIYEPVVERLVRDNYPEYFYAIFNKIPNFNLLSVLKKTACKRRLKEAKGKGECLAGLFSSDIIYWFSENLSNVDIFCLIVAFSDVIIVESMQNLRARDPFNFFDWKL